MRVLSSVAVVVLLTAVSCERAPSKPASLRAANCDAVTPLLNTRGRLAAMISVHANAFGSAEHIELLPLATAATVLECDVQAEGPGAKSRKRRAVAELAAFGRFREFAGPLGRLGVDPKALETAVRAANPDTFPFLLANPTILEMVVSNMIAEQPTLAALPVPSTLPPGTFAVVDPTAVCEWKQEAPFSVWNLSQRIVIGGQISLDVPRRIVRANIDPQRWDECSKLWDPPPKATMLVQPALGGGYQELPSPPPPGNEYGPEFLREFFTCNASGCSAWFRNVLSVAIEHKTLPSHPSQKGYLTSYGLTEAEGGCIGSLLDSCAGGNVVKTDTDYGWLELWEDKGRVMLVTHKEVAFDNAIANGISQALFAHAELARELAEVACCFKARGP